MFHTWDSQQIQGYYGAKVPNSLSSRGMFKLVGIRGQVQAGILVSNLYRY